MDISSLDFEKMPDGLLPAVVQDVHTRRVLMLGYMNAEAVARTQETGLVTFYSRSKQRLWQKGETSGHTLEYQSMEADCDNDALLIQAVSNGPVCHTGAETCWNEENKSAGFLETLERIIARRRHDDPETSYTARLMARGVAKIGQKVGEEAVETLIEALQDDRERLLEESADLLFHLMVLWAAKDVKLAEVEAVLERRNNKR